MAGGNCEKDTFGNDCHDPILNDATLLMVWFVCCLFDDCHRNFYVEMVPDGVDIYFMMQCLSVCHEK